MFTEILRMQICRKIREEKENCFSPRIILLMKNRTQNKRYYINRFDYFTYNIINRRFFCFPFTDLYLLVKLYFNFFFPFLHSFFIPRATNERHLASVWYYYSIIIIAFVVSKTHWNRIIRICFFYDCQTDNQ